MTASGGARNFTSFFLSLSLSLFLSISLFLKFSLSPSSSADERKGDKETKIWRAAFRPGSHTLATCGGNYVCLIDCAAAKVAAAADVFYTLYPCKIVSTISDVSIL